MTTLNIHEIISMSASRLSLEGDIFYTDLSMWEGIGNSGFGQLESLKKYYGTHWYKFFRFLKARRKKNIRGIEIESNRYVKFFFEEEQSNIAYSDWGRIFINYRHQLCCGNVISDIPNGSGLSAGYFDKVFMYFGSCYSYGESLLILRPLKDEYYRLNDYECLGNKYVVEQELSLTDATAITFLIKEMSTEARDSFLHCKKNNSIRDSYGQIDTTVSKMKELDAERYADAIHYLEELMITQNASKKESSTI